MRSILNIVLFALLAICTFSNSFAQMGPNERRPQPFNKPTDLRFKGLENERRVLKLPYTFTSTNAASGASNALGAAIPAGSYILKSYVIVDTDVVSGSSNTVSYGCASAVDLAAANNYADDSVNTIVAGAITTESGTVYTASGCTPTIYIGGGATGVTSGSLVLVTEFMKASNLLGLGDIKVFP